MDWLIVEGLQPYDGRYEFEFGEANLTRLELRWIKRHSGYTGYTLSDGLTAGDQDFLDALAAIALHRGGALTDETDVFAFLKRLDNTPIGSVIRFEFGEQDTEDDASPPVTSSSENGASSGAATPTSSATSPTTPPETGTHDLATSVLPPTRSAT